jgi:hypothetical protein
MVSKVCTPAVAPHTNGFPRDKVPYFTGSTMA